MNRPSVSIQDDILGNDLIRDRDRQHATRSDGFLRKTTTDTAGHFISAFKQESQRRIVLRPKSNNSSLKARQR